MSEVSPLPDRFWAKVNKTESCWLWTAFIDEGGYGKFARGGRRGGMDRAHRVAYAAFNGPIPDGMYVDHQCHVRHCVNPAHLRLATPRENSQNRSGASRNNSTGVRGVRRKPSVRKYEVRVFHAGVRHNGGTYATLEEAEQAAILLRSRLMSNNSVDRRLTLIADPSA